jgi:2-polyprenyl-3-methyl-5-hydroxy-6-metoxy-1,4-benzoquinol methylase
MHYGVDVGATRLDDVDKKVLARVRELVVAGRKPMVLDIGAGAGGLAVVLATAGAQVAALDIADYRQEITARAVQAGIAVDTIEIVVADAVTWPATTAIHYDIVVIQRMLHYLPYYDTVVLLERLHVITDELYLSVTGTTTAIAKHYSALSEPIEARWGRLDLVGQELFSITAPMCLYSEDEILELLISTGWQVDWHRVSDFGNVKVVAY